MAKNSECPVTPQDSLNFTNDSDDSKDQIMTTKQNLTAIKQEVFAISDEVESSKCGRSNTNVLRDNKPFSVSLVNQTDTSGSETNKNIQTIFESNVVQATCDDMEIGNSSSENEEFIDNGADDTVDGSKINDSERCSMNTNVDGRDSPCSSRIQTINEMYDFEGAEVNRDTNSQNDIETGSEASDLYNEECETYDIQSIRGFGIDENWSERNNLENNTMKQFNTSKSDCRGCNRREFENLVATESSEQARHPFEFLLDNMTYNAEQFEITKCPRPEPVFTAKLREVIDSNGLKELVKNLIHETEVGVDLIVNYQAFAPAVNAILLSTRTENIMVDTQMIGDDVTKLNEIFMNQKIVKVFFSDKQNENLKYLQKLLLYPNNIFDIETAYLSLGEKVSNFWSFLKDRYVVNKGHYSASSVIVRPLQENTRTFYKMKIHYLLHMYNSVKNKLLRISEEKCREVLDNCNRLCRIVYGPEDRYSKSFNQLVANIKKIQQSQIMFLKKLQEWRLDVAKDHGMTPNIVMNPKTMAALTLDMPLYGDEIPMYLNTKFARDSVSSIQRLAQVCWKDVQEVAGVLKLRIKARKWTQNPRLNKWSNPGKTIQEVEPVKPTNRTQQRLRKKLNAAGAIGNTSLTKKLLIQQKEKYKWTANLPTKFKYENPKRNARTLQHSGRTADNLDRFGNKMLSPVNSTNEPVCKNRLGRNCISTSDSFELNHFNSNQLPQNVFNTTPNVGTATGGNLAELQQSLSNVANSSGLQDGNKIIPDIIKLAQNLVTLLPQTVTHAQPPNNFNNLADQQPRSFNSNFQQPINYNPNVQPVSSFNSSVQQLVNYNPTVQPYNSFNSNVQPSNFNANVQANNFNVAVQQSTGFNATVHHHNNFNPVVQSSGSSNSIVQPPISYNPAVKPPNSFNTNFQSSNFNLAVQQATGFNATVYNPNSCNSNVQNTSGVSILAQQSINIKPNVQHLYGLKSRVEQSNNFNSIVQQSDTLKLNVQQPGVSSQMVSPQAVFVQEPVLEISSKVNKQQSKCFNKFSKSSNQLVKLKETLHQRVSRFDQTSKQTSTEVNVSNQKQFTNKFRSKDIKQQLRNLKKSLDQPTINQPLTSFQPSSSQSLQQNQKQNAAKESLNSKQQSKSSENKRQLSPDGDCDRHLGGDEATFEAPPAPRISDVDLNNTNNEDDRRWMSGGNLDFDQIDKRINQLQKQYFKVKRRRKP